MKAIAKRLFAPARKYVPASINQWWDGRHVDLRVDAKKFANFQEPLRTVLTKVAHTRYYSAAEHKLIRGWLTPLERQTLYGLGRWLSGPITEIGSWVGLSTSAIARGIRDSGVTKEFNSYDLPLTLENFRSAGDAIGMFLPGNDAPLGSTTPEAYNRDIYPVVSAPGGSNGMLQSNLAALNLAQFVTPHFGDFKAFTPVMSRVLFCDALHDEIEIRSNAPSLQPWLQKGSLLACHDVASSQNNIEILRSILSLGAGASVDSLYLVEVV